MEKRSDYESQNAEQFEKSRSRRDTRRTDLVALHKVCDAFAEGIAGHLSGMNRTRDFPKTSGP